MIAKANTHDNGSRLARYITSGKEGEVAELWELRGFASRDVVDAFRSVHIMAQGGKCERPFLHVQVRNREGEVLTRSQWQTVADRIERILGFRDQPRAIAVHFDERTGHEHLHIAFSRIDAETLKARPLPFSNIRLKKLCRELESQFGFAPVTNDRPGPIKFPPTRDQQAQAARLGVDVREVLETIRQCFDHSDCGRSFKAALASNRLVLTKGDRRDFVVVDHAGGIHALGKRLLGLPVSQVRAHLSDLATENLPTVEQARSELITAQGSRKKTTVEGQLRHRTPNKLPTPKMGAPSPRISDAPDEHPDWLGVSTVLSVPDLQLEPPATGRPSQATRDASQDIIAEAIAPTSLDAFEVDNPATQLPQAISRQASDQFQPEPERRQVTPKRIGMADTLRKQFRAVVRALLRRAPAPQSQGRRRRSGETISGFRLAARSILRPFIRLPAVSHAVGFLSEALPWLHLWEWNDVADQGFTEAPDRSDGNHLSPHP